MTSRLSQPVPTLPLSLLPLILLLHLQTLSYAAYRLPLYQQLALPASLLPNSVNPLEPEPSVPAFATPSPSSTPPNPTTGLFKCPRDRIDDFFACNCHFLRVTRRAALRPKDKIDKILLKGAISSCIRQFGSKGALRKACLRIQIKTKNRRKDRRFSKRRARNGMTRFIEECV